MLYPSNKEKKRKEILNNDLAILPSHDRWQLKTILNCKS